MKISKFQIIILAIFTVFIVVGVAAFATYRGSGSSTALPPIVIWGTFPAKYFTQYLSKVNDTLPQPLSVTYVEKSPAQFSGDFIAELARGRGPDGILIPSDMLLPHLDKLALVPYSALTQRQFLDSYISEGELYLNQAGILAIPFAVDPLIMYWNRDMFDAAGIATYPRYWDEFAGLSTKITVKDQNGNVRKSAVALGAFSNITNARELLGSLILQVGNAVTVRDASGNIASTLKPSASPSPLPALQFFARSVDPSSPSYSWNRGLPVDKQAFLSGMLATYFGFASELKDIRAKNPNLNFDAAALPQVRTGGIKATYGKMYGFSIVKASPNPNVVYQVISALTAPEHISVLSNMLYLPTVRRDLIAQGSSDAYISIFDQSALVARSWLDADPSESRRIMGAMVDAVTSGGKTAYDALQDAGDEYDVVLQRAMQ